MNALIVYFTKFGNTQHVAEVIAKKMNSFGQAEAIHLEDLQPVDFSGVDLVVMGSPTHRMNLPQSVRPILENLPRGCLKGKRVAAFDTSYKMNAFLARLTAAKKIERRLRRLGGQSIISPETFHVMDTEGPLYSGEIDRAGDWAAEISIKFTG